VAPALLKGAKTSPAMDVYGFGFVLYELIAGVHPIADGDVSLPDLVKWHIPFAGAGDFNAFERPFARRRRR
jgi:hypothetical protein